MFDTGIKFRINNNFAPINLIVQENEDIQF
jgi:hypothetical protein